MRDKISMFFIFLFASISIGDAGRVYPPNHNTNDNDNLVDCKYEMPKQDRCQQIIQWKVSNAKQAKAVCMKFFPTPFIEATFVGDEVTCIILPAYMCKENNAVLLFDKCIVFESSEKTIKSNKNCKLPSLYSSKYANFLGMAAAKKGIKKVWIGMNRKGTELTKNQEPSSMIIRSQFWNFAKPEKYWSSSGQKNGEGQYIFYRTKTDHVNHILQGTFEYADETAVATHACEHSAHPSSYHEWYCSRMEDLGIDAVYDAVRKTCLYLSTTNYKFNERKDLKQFEGCQENPFASLHSSGIDDGSSFIDAYKLFSYKGAARISGIHVSLEAFNYGSSLKNYPTVTQEKCKPKITDSKKLENLRMQWKVYDHFGNLIFPGQRKWKDNYPKNACSTFPGYSNSLGIEQGEIIDLPWEDKLPVICSLRSFQECKIKKSKGETTCTGTTFCENEERFQGATNGHYSCVCPDVHRQEGDRCIWKLDDKYCAYLYYWNTDDNNETPRKMPFIKTGDDKWGLPTGDLPSGTDGNTYNDKVYKAIVRERCVLNVFAHESSLHKEDNPVILDAATYGTHDVPNGYTRTQNTVALGGTSASCKCS